MALERLPAEILWEILEYVQLALPVGYHGYYQNTPDQTLKTLRGRFGLNFAHTSSKLYYSLLPRLWSNVALSTTRHDPLWALEELDKQGLARHITTLEIQLRDDLHAQDIVSPNLTPRLTELRIDVEHHYPSSEVQAEWGNQLARFQTRVAVDLINVPALRLHELTDTIFLAHVRSLTFALSPTNLKFSDSLESSIGRMSALRSLKSKEMRDDGGEPHCFRPVANLGVIRAIQNLPLLSELDLNDLTAAIGTITSGQTDWFPARISTLRCDWNFMNALLASNSPARFSSVKDLSIIMTRQILKRVPNLGPFINVERLSLVRGPSPWPQDDVVELFATLVKSNTKLKSVSLSGISSSEISAMSPMFSNLHELHVPQMPEDSYSLGIHFSDRGLSNLQAPVNQILSSASPNLKVLDLHITKRAHSISFPLLESLVIDSTPASFPLTHIVVLYEQTRLYERKYPDPIEKIFTGFSSNKFSIHSFCTPLRSVASLNKEATCSFAERRELFGPKRVSWDPIVIDIEKLRTLLLIPPKGSRIQSPPLTSAIFSSPIVSC